MLTLPSIKDELNERQRRFDAEQVTHYEEMLSTAQQFAATINTDLQAARELLQNILRAEYGAMTALDNYIDLRIKKHASDQSIELLRIAVDAYKEREGA